ncbi:MAG TPA: lytic transglycosylase domain-containing protein [Blastocatellia bacterium]|nr:lytic transglycosylase domain-containing protein [Blastocatellia bacterium]
MIAVPIIVLILTAAASFTGARVAKRIAIPERSSVIWIVCAIGFALLFAPAQWKLRLSGGLAGDRAMVVARYIGASGLLFIAGTRLNLKETWEQRRASALAACAILLGAAVFAIMLNSTSSLSRPELAVAIAAWAGASPWLPGIAKREASRVNAISGGAAVATTLLVLVLMHLYEALDFLVRRRAPWTAYAAVLAFEAGKIVMFFAAAYFVASTYIRNAGALRDRPRVLIGYLLIAGFVFALGFSMVGPLAALGWCYVVGLLFAHTKAGYQLAQSETLFSSSVLLSLAFISIALQSHGRTAGIPWVLAISAIAAIAFKFAAAWGAVRAAGLENRQSLSVAARIISPGEIAPVVLWLGMAHWLIGGDAYFAVLFFTFLSTSLGEAARLFLAMKTTVTSIPNSGEEVAVKRRSSRRGGHSAAAVAVILLTLTAVYSVNAQSVSSAQDPVAKAMERIKESVDARASEADRVLAAHKLIEDSKELRKEGKEQDSAESLAKAITLLDGSLETGANPSVESYRMALLDEARRDSGNNPSLPTVVIPASSMPTLSKTGVSRTVLLRFNEYRGRLAPILEEERLPPQLLAVALVESGFNPFALSPKGARGIWQFMPTTARRYGLLVLPGDDRRTHPEESTRAAARYLRDLYQRFGDWKLALAAYNSGEQRVDRAIAKSGSRNFEELAAYLPAETRSYVPAVLAAWSRLTPPTSPDSQRAVMPGASDTRDIGTVYATTYKKRIEGNGGEGK